MPPDVRFYAPNSIYPDPDPAGGAYSAPPYPLAEFNGAYF